MIKRLLISFIFLFLFINNSNANCVSSACTVDANFVLSGMNCAMFTETCYGDGTIGFISCDSCPSGYSLESMPGTPDTCNYSYNTCELNCTGCTNCISDTSWSYYSAGYEKFVTRTCNCNTCQTSTTYRCASGYYGTSNILGTSGCNSCVTATGISGSTSVAGSNSLITNCYLPTTYSVTDSTGSWRYSQPCYYSL